MKTAFALCLTVAGAVLAGTAHADCMCAANGTRYEQGAVACLTVSGRSWLARCGKVLNNSSWERISDGCPYTRQPSATTVKMQRPDTKPG